MTAGVRKPGEFCWINILTRKPSEEKAFFAGVLGWTFGDIPGMGYAIKVDDRDMGGLFELDAPQTPPGVRPHVGVMIKVESADRTVERVRELGGRAQPPFDVGDGGRMAVCHDPVGAEFDVWEAKQRAGTEVDSQAPGAATWFENLTTDVPAAQAFYTSLFGWSALVRPTPGTRYTYTLLRHGSTPIAGMMPILPEFGGIPPLWSTYFAVESADEASKQAVRLGGDALEEVQEIEGAGRIVLLCSPQGVHFHVISNSS